MLVTRLLVVVSLVSARPQVRAPKPSNEPSYLSVNRTMTDAASSLAKCLLTQHEPVIVTLADSAYADLLAPWTELVARMGWSQRVIVALDDSTYAMARALSYGELFTCTVPFFPLHHVDVVAVHNSIKGQAARTLPMFTGLARFSVLHLLLAAGHGAGGITLSEMDVLWFMPPWAALASATPLTSLLCLDNFPAATQSTNAANIGIIHIRHDTAGFAGRFFAHVLGRWRRRLLATSGRAGLVVGEEQIFLNRELATWPDRDERGRSFGLLNRSQFVNTRLLGAYGRGRYKVARPKGAALRLVNAGLPHAHLKSSLVAFHAISLAPKVKRKLLLQLYRGNLTLDKFAKTPWQALVS